MVSGFPVLIRSGLIADLPLAEERFRQEFYYTLGSIGGETGRLSLVHYSSLVIAHNLPTFLPGIHRLVRFLLHVGILCDWVYLVRR